jgi:hypothetical protein
MQVCFERISLRVRALIGREARLDPRELASGGDVCGGFKKETPRLRIEREAFRLSRLLAVFVL